MKRLNPVYKRDWVKRLVKSFINTISLVLGTLGNGGTQRRIAFSKQYTVRKAMIANIEFWKLSLKEVSFLEPLERTVGGGCHHFVWFVLSETDEIRASKLKT